MTRDIQGGTAERTRQTTIEDEGPTTVTVPEPGRVGTARFVATTLRNDITDGFAFLADEYGTPVRFTAPGSDVEGMLLSDPARVQHVLETHQSNYQKPDVYFDMLSHLGESLLTTQGDAWLEQHRTLAPLFQTEAVAGFAGVVARRAQALVDRWRRAAERGRSIDLGDEMRDLTLDIIGRTMFSSDVEAFAAELTAATDALRERMWREQSPVPYPDRLLERRYRGPVATLEDIAARLIRERRGCEDEYDDLLTMLMTAGDAMDDQRVVDNVITFLLAGHDTTALALIWTWYLLAQEPDVHRRVHDAAQAASIPDDGSNSPVVDGDLETVERAVQEAMRIFPPVPFFTREAIETDRVGGVRIPAGTTLLVSQYLTHRDPALWDDPLAYRPERFDSETGTDRPKYSFYPFGGGGRMCIGRTFALMEARLILAIVTAELRLELESPRAGRAVDVTTATTMVPDPEIRMSVHEWD